MNKRGINQNKIKTITKTEKTMSNTLLKKALISLFNDMSCIVRIGK
jgi:hypothetical protein